MSRAETPRSSITGSAFCSGASSGTLFVGTKRLVAHYAQLASGDSAQFAPKVDFSARLHHRGNEVADAANQIPDRIPINLVVNGVRRTIELVPWTTLLDALRDHLALTGTKKGCDHGQCGACTVLVDGRRVNSCLTLAVMKDGSEVTTVEGLAKDSTLHPLQQAFIDHDAFQCGYCTPGQICSAAGLLAEGRARDAEEIRELMSGNLCRCGAYPNIVAAIQQAMGEP
jgi:xanthine dehydrogenase YagT iron-sulfur-binding subunit